MSSSNCCKHSFLILSAMFPAVFVSALASMAIIFPSQILDVYRDTAQSIEFDMITRSPKVFVDYLQIYREILLSGVFVTFLCVIIWLVGKAMSATLMEKTPEICYVACKVQDATVIIFALLPIIALALGLFSAKVEDESMRRISEFIESTYITSALSNGVSPQGAQVDAKTFAAAMTDSNRMLDYWGATILFISILLLFIFLRLKKRVSSFFFIRSRRQIRLGTSAFYAAVISSLIVALSLLVAENPILLSEALTPLSVFALFCIFLIISMDILCRFSELTGVPILTSTIAFAIVFSLLNLNDNNAIRYEHFARPDTPLQLLPSAGEEFQNWIKIREDLEKFADDRPYPIYVIAAQGGGAYAAYHTAIFLSGAQQQCPNFSHHLFAISSVSGGSVGASVFAALMQEAQRNGDVSMIEQGCHADREAIKPPYVEAAIAMLRKDFWSPLQASLLFPDFLQRFLFWPIQRFNRALALEHALELAWIDLPNEVRFGATDLPRRNGMAAPFVDYWDVSRFRDSPALLINTTEVQTGNRRVIAPFHFQGAGGLKFFPLLRDDETGRWAKLPLSTAAVLSARFPWITPYGWIMEPSRDKAEKRHFVDGGYFENSGVATASDLIKDLLVQLGKSPLNRRIEINLIILTSKDFAPPDAVLGEMFGPVQAMLNTRSARAAIEIDRAKADLKKLSSDEVGIRTIEVELKGLGYPLPLGWRLSTVTRYLIEYQKGNASRCRTESGENNQAASEAEAMNSSDCAKAFILRQLSH